MNTMTTTMDDRDLVTSERIAALTPIENADLIELATVRGWNVVVKKGEFSVGDPVLYFEIDSLLPIDDERFAFLEPRGTKVIDGRTYHRLKTARLRGVYSQGLAIDARQFATEFDEWCIESTEEMGCAHGIGFDQYLADTLGIIKFEEEIPDGASGRYPDKLGRKTASARAQNLIAQWGSLLAEGPWLAVEKVDGKSCSVFRDAESDLHVCGRNWEVPAPEADGQADVYWRAALSLFGPNGTGTLEPGEGVQFEVYGDGIVKNPLRVRGEHVAIFNFTRDGKSVPRADWPQWAVDRAAPLHDLPFPATAEDAIAQVEGLISKLADRPAEGIVWTQAEYRDIPVLNDRPTVKAINNRYLIKTQG